MSAIEPYQVANSHYRHAQMTTKYCRSFTYFTCQGHIFHKFFIFHTPLRWDSILHLTDVSLSLYSTYVLVSDDIYQIEMCILCTFSLTKVYHSTLSVKVKEHMTLKQVKFSKAQLHLTNSVQALHLPQHTQQDI